MQLNADFFAGSSGECHIAGASGSAGEREPCAAYGVGGGKLAIHSAMDRAASIS
jgi:hypothetical protein